MYSCEYRDYMSLNYLCISIIVHVRVYKLYMNIYIYVYVNMFDIRVVMHLN